MIRTERTAKVFEPIQVTRLVEDLGVNFDGAMGREYPGATAGRFFCIRGVGGAVRAQEELGRSTGGGFYEGNSMDLGLFVLID